MYVGGDPKVSKGERRKAGIQWIQPPKAVSDPEFRQTTSGAHGSAGRVDCLPRGKPPACIVKRQLCRKQFPLAGSDAPTPARGEGLAALWGALLLQGANRRFPKGERKALWCARRRIPLPPAGIDAPTPAREKGLQPYGALTLFFRWRKKSVQKKASGTATPGKSPLLPILAAGLAMSRAA